MDLGYLDSVAHQIRDRVPASDIPDENNTDGLFRIYAVLLLAKGSLVSREDVHNAWVAWMLDVNPTHESLIPFSELDPHTADDDEPYVAAIRPIDATLFPNGVPQAKEEIERTIELYKLMVTSSESLVARRQGVNTFFLTAHGAILTAAGLLLGNGAAPALRNWGMLVLALTGFVLAMAWRSLIKSAGQLNTGKFVVINRIEKLLPVAVYLAEWKALEEGKNPSKYQTFTSRETWVPTTFQVIYVIGAVADIIFLSHVVIAHLFQSLLCLL